MNLEKIYSKIGGSGGDLQRGLTASAPLKPPPQGAKFTSQVDACVRTDAQIKFLYYPHLCTFYPPGKQTRDFVIMDRCAKH